MPAYSGYLVATASPGPSSLAIMAVAMNSGRRVRSGNRSLRRANQQAADGREDLDDRCCRAASHQRASAEGLGNRIAWPW
jgi:hypothetical protein